MHQPRCPSFWAGNSSCQTPQRQWTMHKGPFDIKKPILRQQVMWWRQANQPTNGSDIQCLKSKRTNLLPCHREDHWLNRIVPSFKHVIGSHGPSVDLESKAAQHQGLKDLDLRFNWYFPFPKKGFLQRPPCLLCFCHPVLDVLPRTAIRLNLSAHMFVAMNQLQLVRYCKVTQSNFRRRWNKVLLLQQSTSFATKCDHQLSFLRLEVHQQASACRSLAPALGYSLSCGNQLMAMGVSNHNADIVNKANIIKCSTGRKNEAIFPLITSFRNAIGKPLHVWGLHLWTIFFQHWTHEQIEANVSNWVTRSGTPLGNTDFVNSSHLKVGPIKNVFENANTMRVHISGSVFVTATVFWNSRPHLDVCPGVARACRACHHSTQCQTRIAGALHKKQNASQEKKRPNWYLLVWWLLGTSAKCDEPYQCLCLFCLPFVYPKQFSS